MNYNNAWLYVTLLAPNGKGGYFVPRDIALSLLDILNNQEPGWIIKEW